MRAREARWPARYSAGPPAMVKSWAAPGVRDGADSFVIEDGRIVAQRIHDTVEKK
jgi:hypothetical protein